MRSFCMKLKIIILKLWEHKANDCVTKDNRKSRLYDLLTKKHSSDVRKYIIRLREKKWYYINTYCYLNIKYSSKKNVKSVLNYLTSWTLHHVCGGEGAVFFYVWYVIDVWHLFFQMRLFVRLLLKWSNTINLNSTGITPSSLSLMLWRTMPENTRETLIMCMSG